MIAEYCCVNIPWLNIEYAFLRFNLLWDSWEIMEWCRWFLLTSFQRWHRQRGSL